MRRTCVLCGDLFTPRHNGQHYCSKKACQRKRKSLWQKEKLANDPAYRDNQADAQRLWRDKNPDYMQEYRQRHPEYVARNRELQKLRRANRSNASLHKKDAVVKMDVRTVQRPVISGTYKLLPMGVVKMDAITVQLSILEGVT